MTVQGWVEAGSLGIGTSIVSRAGPALSVTNVTWKRDKSKELAAGSSSSTQGGYTVYNLTVEDDHTYFVGTTGGGTWVHNASPCTTLTRFGSDYENAEKLAADAAKAESQGYPHGVSAIGDAIRPGSVAKYEDVANEFNVLKTGRSPSHYTIELPKPVTDEVAATFNQIFGRIP